MAEEQYFCISEINLLPRIMKKLISSLSVLAFVGVAQVVFANSVIISEINYHPADSDLGAGDYYEYVELKNVSSSPIDISDYKFISGLDSDFPQGTVLDAGGYFVLARSSVYFKSRYEKEPDGQYTRGSQLANSGERLVLANGNGDTVANVKYSDGGSWPFLADGFGFSLEVIDGQADNKDADNWRLSGTLNGSPWSDGQQLAVAPVYINEIFAHSENPSVDSIELYNPNDVAVDISGWSLTDKKGEATAFILPQGTTIQPQSYLVLAQGEISQSGLTVIATDDLHFGFGLSSNGDNLYLFSGKDGQLTGFVDEVSIPATRVGRTLSRFQTTEGRIVYMESAATLGSVNEQPAPGPLVFEEIMYAPSEGNYEYIKVRNISTQTVNIDLWDFSGIGFEKDSLYADILADEFFYLVEDTVADTVFRKVMSLDESVKVFGFSKSLSNNGEQLEILERGDSVISATDTVIPYYQVDAVRYNDKAPWPIGAASGEVLVRKDLYAFSNDPSNWKSVDLDLPTAILSGPANAEKDQTVSVSGASSSDPQGSALTYSWSIKKPSDADFVPMSETAAEISFVVDQYGDYVVRLQVNNGKKTSFYNDHKISVPEPLTSVGEEVTVLPVIFPTVIDNSFSINIGSTDYQSFRLVSMDGSTVLAGKLTEKLTAIVLDSLNLDEGYLVVILSNESGVYAEKVYFTGN